MTTNYNPYMLSGWSKPKNLSWLEMQLLPLLASKPVPVSPSKFDNPLRNLLTSFPSLPETITRKILPLSEQFFPMENTFTGDVPKSPRKLFRRKLLLGFGIILINFQPTKYPFITRENAVDVGENSPSLNQSNPASVLNVHQNYASNSHSPSSKKRWYEIIISFFCTNIISVSPLYF